MKKVRAISYIRARMFPVLYRFFWALFKVSPSSAIWLLEVALQVKKSKFLKLVLGEFLLETNAQKRALEVWVEVYRDFIPHCAWQTKYKGSFSTLLLADCSTREILETLPPSIFLTFNAAAEFSFWPEFYRKHSESLPALLSRWNRVLEDHEVSLLRTIEIDAVAETFNSFPEDTFFFHDPKVVNETTPPLKREVAVSPQKTYRLRNAVIAGAWQVIADDRLVIYDTSGNPAVSNGIVAGVWKNFVSLKDRENKILAKLPSRKVQTIATGILLSGRATENYFHWLIEYLPRLLNLKGAPIPDNVPLLVADNLPKQFYEVLELFRGQRPFLKWNPQMEQYRVEELWIPSFHTCHPDDPLLPFWKGSALSLRHLDFLRKTVFNSTLRTSPKALPRKIYLKRGGVRSLLNANQIEKILADHGFAIVSPEKMSFADQVRLFSEAEVVFGAGGAAFSNCIFMKPGAKVFSFISKRNKDYSMQGNLAAFAGADFALILGEPERPREKYANETAYMHASYRVDLNYLEAALDNLKQEGLIQ